MLPRSTLRPIPPLLAAALLVGALTAAALAQTSDAARDKRLRKKLDLEVRSAALGDVLDQLSRALKVKLAAEPRLADQRITVYAEGINVAEFQVALTGLLRGPWRRLGGEGKKARYLMAENDRLASRVLQLRRRRRRKLVDGWLATAERIQQLRPEEHAAYLRAQLRSRRPDLPAERIALVDVDYLRQAILLHPLRIVGSKRLARNGIFWAPASRLTAQQRAMYSAFARERMARRARSSRSGDSAGPDGRPSSPTPAAGGGEAENRPAPPLPANVGNLDYPEARIEYRLIYGDRWSDTVLLVRVGAPDDWATATLPGVMYDLPDYSTLYPDARVPAVDSEVYKRVPGRFDFDRMTFDQGLSAVAKTAKIRAIADSYQRPEIHRPPLASRIVQGYTLKETLDRLARLHGYFWWKQNGWYFFRHRYWGEEARVSVPDHIYQLLGERVAAGKGRLTASGMRTLSGLSLEQLMTLHLTGTAAGERVANEEAFNLNEIEWCHSGLALLRRMNADQLERALDKGLPASAMSPGQQAVLERVAREHGFPLDPAGAASWGLRVASNFRRVAGGERPVYAGAIRFDFSFGSGQQRRAEIAVRLPIPAGFDLPETESAPQERVND